MENATKALLIAAGILIVIVLIGFGMNIINTSKTAVSSGTSTGSELSSQAKLAANAATETFKNATTDLINGTK